MPGAPPVMLLSEAEMTWAPFSSNEILEPTASSCSWVPAASGPLLYVLPSWSAARRPLVQHQFRAAVVPVVEADVAVLPAVLLHPHRRADPLPAGQLRRGELDLRELITGQRIQRSTRPLVTRPAVPITVPEEIAIAPSEISVQFAPSGPSARLKLSEALVAVDPAVQETATLVTSAEADRARTAGDRAGLAGRTGLHCHVVRRASGQGSSERERAVTADAEVVTTVILQHHRPGKPRNSAPDRVTHDVPARTSSPVLRGRCRRP